MRELLATDRAEMLAIIGRRRVGKTYMIGEVYADELVFSFTGTQDASKSNQLKKFATKLSEYYPKNVEISKPKNWAEGFAKLKDYLLGLRKSKKKRVIFLDELPWMASARSGFLKELTYWWNDWASKQNLLLVICGSSASWMIDRVINNKGGLHNRITAKINLQPFTLAETKAYLLKINPALTHYQLIQIYMAIGGIPYYLQHIKRGESATQAINRLCFDKDGVLRTEFDNLYAALFDNYENHVLIIKALASKWKGLTRQEIIAYTQISDGGGLTKMLTELVASSFVLEVLPYGKKKKDTLYRLVDEYSLFYLSYIEDQRAGSKDIWMHQESTHQYAIWRGYAFENICIKHAEAIKTALGISGIKTNISSYLSKEPSTNEVIQIDMLIDRADNAINICEMKFYNAELTITADMAKKLRGRRAKFVEATRTKKAVYNTLVTTYGLERNAHNYSEIDSAINMDALFELESF